MNINFTNAVKQSAATGKQIRGVHFTFAAPAAIEVLSHADLQFIYIDGEHGCFDWRDIEVACITAERYGMTVIARIPDISRSTITRFLDRGVRGIVAPHIETIEQAHQVVDATYFAPLGNRSFGAGRPEYGQRIGNRPEYMQACNDAASICLMIESKAGLDIAGDLANVAGVDYLSFGMLDLAQSLGHVGNSNHPDVISDAAAATALIHQAGKRVREDFMQFCWINDILSAGVTKLMPHSLK
jgi:2-keto-3-deoxy-L-rhamnonate aldolase RhmA